MTIANWSCKCVPRPDDGMGLAPKICRESIRICNIHRASLVGSAFASTHLIDNRHPQYVFVAFRTWEGSHEIDAPNVKDFTNLDGILGISSLCENFPCRWHESQFFLTTRVHPCYEGQKISGIKGLFGGEICTVMSPGGSIVASFENVESFFVVHTPPDHLIRTDFEQEGVIPEVVFDIFEKLHEEQPIQEFQEEMFRDFLVLEFILMRVLNVLVGNVVFSLPRTAPIEISLASHMMFEGKENGVPFQAGESLGGILFEKSCMNGALHSPKRHAGGRQMLYGQGKVVFSGSFGLWESGNNRKAIEGNIRMVSRESFRALIMIEGSRKWTFSGASFNFYSRMALLSTLRTNRVGYKIIFIVFDDGHATLFWYTMHRAYPWTVRDRINQSGVKKLFNFFLDDVVDFWDFPTFDAECCGDGSILSEFAIGGASMSPSGIIIVEDSTSVKLDHPL
ncbi:hypothetical protein Tco_0115318 [Tanacetum coccineum]